MSLQQIYDMAKSGAWATENPLECACNGSGWMSSDVDTWHECPIHSFEGNPHPEYVEEDTDWDAIEELRTKRFREMYRSIRERTRLAGWEGTDNEFNTQGNGSLHDPAFIRRYRLREDFKVQPTHWIAAALWLEDEWVRHMEGMEQTHYEAACMDDCYDF